MTASRSSAVAYVWMPICASPRVQSMAIVGSDGSPGSTSRRLSSLHPMAETRSSAVDGEDAREELEPASAPGLRSSAPELHATNDANVIAINATFGAATAKLCLTCEADPRA